MHTRHAILPTLGLILVTPVLAAGHPTAHASVPPASFLNYHVSTVRELSQEVTIDPSVRARLANHFHISETQITQYVRRNLVLTHLKRGGTYRVACVGRDGQEYWIESHLPAGTAVFASRVTGHPILKLACGNPMVSSLPPGLQTAEDNGKAGPPQFAYLPPPATTDAVPMPGLLTIADVTPADLAVATTDVTPTVVLVSDFPPFSPGVGSSRAFSFLPAILGAAAVGIASSGHGGSTPNAIPPPSVPEASSLVSLGVMLLLGSSALFVTRRKRMPNKGR